MYDSDSKTRRDYILTGTSLFVFSFSFGAMTYSDYGPFTYAFWAVGFIAGFLFFPVWLIFISNMVRFKHKSIKYILYCKLVVSVLLALMCIYFGGVTFKATSYGNQFSYQNNFVFNILFGYALLLMAALFAIHLKWFLQSELKRNRRQVLIIILFSIVCTPVALATEFIIPIYTDATVIPLGSLVLLPASLFVFYSMKNFKLFGITVSNVSGDIFSSITRPIYVLDNRNVIVIENYAAIECFGGRAVGKKFSDCIMVNEKFPNIKFFDDSFISKTVALIADSGIVICDMSLTIGKDNFDDAIYKIVVLKDMTDIKDMENKLRRALHDAIEASKVKSEFIAKMSHEIRTPMNAIIGMNELVLRENSSATVQENAITIKQASENLLSIIDELLDFSKIEAGNIMLSPVSYSLSSLINDVISIIRTKITSSEVQFVTNVDSNLPDVLFGDEVKIRQALINLLGNAAKHTESGSIALTVVGKHIDDNKLLLSMMVEDTGSGIEKEALDNLFTEYYQVHSGSDGIGLGLAITNGIVEAMNGTISVDSEIGVGSTFTIKFPQLIESPEKIAVVENIENKKSLVYEPRETTAVSLFFAIDSLGIECDLVSENDSFFDMAKRTSYDYIFVSHTQFIENQDMIRKMCADSKVVLLSEFGRSVPLGPWINLTLPMSVINVANVFNRDGDIGVVFEDDLSNAIFAATSARVLVVDDINTNLKVAFGLLQPYKMTVDLCLSGKEAIEAVKMHKYDLVFMDHRMPDMDGLETTKRIRAIDYTDSYYTKLPIIALTANAVSGMREMFLEMGFDDFVSKPIDITELNAVLKKWIPEEKQAALETGAGSVDGDAGVGEGGASGTVIIADAIEGLDVSKGILRSGGTVEYFYETLASFHSDATERFEPIRKCVETRDTLQYITIVHAIKSASANIGADEVSSLAAALETAGENNDWDYINRRNDKFLAGLDKVLASIKAALTAFDAKCDGEKEYVKDEQIQKELDDLKAALDDINIDLINNLVDTLLNQARTDDEKRALRDISHHILMFEYDEARELIDKF